jgi:hypothetical protein
MFVGVVASVLAQAGTNDCEIFNTCGNPGGDGWIVWGLIVGGILGGALWKHMRDEREAESYRRGRQAAEAKAAAEATAQREREAEEALEAELEAIDRKYEAEKAEREAKFNAERAERSAYWDARRDYYDTRRAYEEAAEAEYHEAFGEPNDDNEDEWDDDYDYDAREEWCYARLVEWGVLLERPAPEPEPELNPAPTGSLAERLANPERYKREAEDYLDFYEEVALLRTLGPERLGKMTRAEAIEWVKSDAGKDAVLDYLRAEHEAYFPGEPFTDTWPR